MSGVPQFFERVTVTANVEGNAEPGGVLTATVVIDIDDGSAQTDVLMGENAYLVEVGQRGMHSLTTNVADTCVTCHMEETPPPAVLSYNQGGTNHTFFASDAICTNCHFFGAEVVQPRVDAGLDQLQGMVEDGLFGLTADQVAAGNTVDLNGAALITDAAAITAVAFGESRGRRAISVTLADGTDVGPVRLSDVDVLDPDGAVAGELYDFADERLPKAGWNWTLVHNDGSRGAHNPRFTTEVLDASIRALKGE